MIAGESFACKVAAPPWVMNPYRLVSLREIMKPFYAQTWLTRIRMLEAALNNRTRTEFDYPDRVKVEDVFHGIEEECIEQDLRSAAISARKMTTLLSQAEIPYERFRELVVEIQERIIDDTTVRRFLSLTDGEGKYYDEWWLGWRETMYRFPSILSDVEEASKCLALNRATACVFHLMRVMEFGLRALRASLKEAPLDPDKHYTWGNLLDRCTKELAKPLADRSPEWRTDEAFYSGATTRLIGVKDAWRNPTMHVRSKYTEEEALDIWNHVKAFMAHLATKLKE